MKFSIEVGKFSNVLDIFSMNGCKDYNGRPTRLINECLLEGNDNTIKLLGTDDANIVFAITEMKEVKNIEEGKFPIYNINLFRGILDLFNKNDEIEISTQTDKIRIFRKYPKKSVRCNLIDISNISNLKELTERVKFDSDGNFIFVSSSKEDFEYPISIDTHSQHFKEIVEASNLKSDEGSVFETVFPISIIKESEKKYILKVDMGDEKFVSMRSEIPANINNPVEMTNHYKVGFDILGKLNGSIKLFLAKDMPLAVKHEQKDLDFLFLISPFDVSH
ncbi:MAG: hypothetical protein ACTSXD_13455 [Candidatus Heimdallarchaeaceae archaeon]